jgi:hypothetical protein
MKNEKITQFTGANVDLLRRKIEAALAEIGEKYNVKFDLGRITYSSTDNTASARLKFETKTDANGAAVDRAAQTWAKNCQYYGLKAEWLNQTFKAKGGEYKIIGLDVNKRRFPVQTIRLSDGKSFGWAEDSVRMLMDPEGTQARIAADAHKMWNAFAGSFATNPMYKGLEPEWLDKTFKLRDLDIKVEGFDGWGHPDAPVVISSIKNGGNNISYVSIEWLKDVVSLQEKSQGKAAA